MFKYPKFRPISIDSWMAGKDAESSEALLRPERDKRQRRKNGTAALTQLFAPLHGPSWDEELDRLNHDESFAENQMQMSQPPELPNRTSTPVNCPSGAMNDHTTEQYFFQPTVHTGRFVCGNGMQPKIFKQSGFFHSNLFRSKARENLGNLFEKSVDKNVETGAVNKKKKTKAKRFFANAVYDFLSLALLGVAMAAVSLLMDLAIEQLGNLHILWFETTRSLHKGLGGIFATYTIWVSFCVILTTGCSVFVHYVSPQAIGSGIPEMKTVLRGVILKEYLSFRTMISKIVGLTLSLGSGMPIGKEGPFVHIGSVMANLLSKLLNTFDSVYINESRHSEMLAVGCAVGVACVFSAPVGGVLFSIEVTSVYFAVRNYWRGFFSAACAATTFRLLRVILSQEVTVTAYFQTHFPKESFFPEELPIFALIGLICGLGSAVFIALHRKLVVFLRSNGAMKKIFQKHWYIYPTLVSFLISTLTYPGGVGQVLGGNKKFSQTAKDFFKNCTWSAPVNSSEYCSESDFLKNWVGTSGHLNIFLVLACFIVIYFFLVILASTVPIPAGTFGPSFTLGAAFGRLVGELVFYIFPNGVREGQTNVQVYPGVYSVVGAAAFCGGITHTVSVAVIIFELTGQLVALLPVMIAVLIANAVCSYFQPSMYDSIIDLKHLPFLPDIPHSSSNFHGIKVEQFMTTDVQHLTPQTTYGELQTILTNESHLKALPVVENSETLILLGSLSRKRLLESLEQKVGHRARQDEALERMNTSFNVLEQRFRSASERSQTILTVNQSKASVELEPEEKLPKKMQFYYNDLPDDQPNSKPSMEDLRKMSRFTVTSVIESNPCRTCNQPKSRRNSISSSEHESESSKNSGRKRNGTLASNLVHGLAEAITHLSTGRYTNRHKFENEIDLHGDERKQWENEQLAQTLDLTEIGVDSAPFQLTANTSLLKVHSLFSLLGLNRAYVTQHGKLIGVVSLRDIRIAIEMVQQGKLPIVNDEQEQEAKRRFRSMSIKEAEDIKNDKLNPQLVQMSRNPSLVSIHDARSLVSLPDKRLSTPHFLSTNPEERIQRRPWQSVPSPVVETIHVHDLKFPQINITPPKEETDSTESLNTEDI